MDAAAWDDRYKTARLLWGTDPNEFLEPLVGHLSPGTALDVACGEGRNALWLAAHGWRVTGIDFSTVAIDRARDAADAAGVSVDFQVADLETWSPSRRYDLVVEFYLQVPADLRRRVHRSAATAVEEGGRYIVVAHHSDNLDHGVGGPQHAAVLFDEVDLLEDFQGLLHPTRTERVERPTEEGVAIDVVFAGRALPQG